MKKQHRLTAANVVTVSGIILAAFSGYHVWGEQLSLALLFFVPAALTDWLDGFLARRLERYFPGWGISSLGETLDPIRDRCLLVPVILINPEILGVLIIIESVSAWRAAEVRRRAGRHVITRFSKIATAVQLPAAGLLFLDPSLDSIAWLIVLASSIRAISYIAVIHRLDPV